MTYYVKPGRIFTPGHSLFFDFLLLNFGLKRLRVFAPYASLREKEAAISRQAAKKLRRSHSFFLTFYF
jgi:hypothetical protein